MQRVSGNGGGGLPRLKVLAYTVPVQTGVVAIVPTFGLLAPRTYAKTGGNANLSINAGTGAISATAAISAGDSQVLTGKVTGADGYVIPFIVTLTGARVLTALSLSASTVVENSAAGTVIGAIMGKAVGSALVLVDSAGGRFAIAGTNLVAGATPTDFETATTHNITIRETLPGALGSPRDTVLAITVANVFEQPNLAALSLSSTALVIGVPASGAITGATAGSAIVATGVPAGLTIDGAARAWAWDGTGAAGTPALTLTETLADSANSPRASVIGLTIAGLDDIASVRGADTKASAGGVNLGQLLAVPMVATSSTYTLVSGTAGHWNLPANGTHPTPNATGVAARLGGGPYVFDYTISDGTRTVSARLTITRDLGRTLAAYDYISKNGGRTAVASETFTAACYTVATTAEFSAITATNASGATVLIAKGASGTIDLNRNTTPTVATLTQSEDIANPSTVSRVIVSSGGKQRFDSLIVQMTRTAANAAFANNPNILRTGTNCTDVRFSRLLVGAPVGTPKNDYPGVSLQQATDMHVVNCRWYRYRAGDLRAQTRPVFKSLRCQYFNVDAFFVGNAANEVWVDPVWEDIIVAEPHRLAGDQNHPDSQQLYLSTGGAGTGIQLQGTTIIADFRSYLGAGDVSFNGAMFSGFGTETGAPKLQGTVLMFGCAHGGLTAYGHGVIGRGDYSTSVATKYYGATNVRQLTGVTGSITAGKESGAQGFDTWSDDGLTSVPANNQRYPGLSSDTQAWPAGCNIQSYYSYYDGKQQGFLAGMDGSTSTFKGLGSSTVNPVGLTPAQINDNSAYFDDPNRVVNWAGMTPEQIDAIYADMYATKAGGPLDNGDGTVRGRWCVRRAGAPAKANQIGRATLAVAHAAGTVTVTLSAVLAVDVICDIRQGASNGALLATVVIPAGQTTAAAPLAIAPGTTIFAANDAGLLNPSTLAAG